MESQGGARWPERKRGPMVMGRCAKLGHWEETCDQRKSFNMRRTGSGKKPVTNVDHSMNLYKYS